MKTFFSELKRRKVVRAAVVYIVVAWIVVEVASVVLPGLLLPDWSERLVLAMAILGFPLALVLAWAFEMTPEGVQREKPGAAVENGAVAAHDAAATTPAAQVAAHACAVRTDERRAIAVLPLTNMSGNPENEFFSDGITEEILNLLARQPELRVVSRTSSFSFKNTSLDVPTIAARLDVDIVLEGSVRRAGDRVRITAQLIDANNDSHLWSDSYDREVGDIFAVQTDIARCIVSAMDLSPDKCVECEGNTADIDAYEFYLRGRQYLYQHLESAMVSARQMFARAIDIDPSYARAYAGLADAHSLIEPAARPWNLPLICRKHMLPAASFCHSMANTRTLRRASIKPWRSTHATTTACISMAARASRRVSSITRSSSGTVRTMPGRTSSKAHRCVPWL
jgi:adenylate cyclase